MKILSWNVNGIRACCDKGFEEVITKYDPDIICLQEIKCDKMNTPNDVYDLIMSKYYYYAWNPAVKKGYSGTAILSKIEAKSMSKGFDSLKIKDEEGRVLTAEFDKFTLVNAYVVNAKMDLSRLDYRVEWEEEMLTYLKQFIKKDKPFIYCGDLNCAVQPCDIYDLYKCGEPGCTVEERECFEKMLNEGLFDVWRLLHEDSRQYTFWSYMGKARENNRGWRLDYFLCNEKAALNVISVDNLTQEYGSDHCPILLNINI